MLDNNSIVIRRADPREPDIRRLIAELDSYMQALYPPESNHLLDIDALAAPQMRLFAAAANGEVLGVGGCKLHEDYAEVKRVYVSPKARGLGLAKRLMAAIEDAAREAGMKIARLETGIHQPEALGLYRALGYAERAPFGDYPADDPNSVFMEKQLG